MSPSKSVNEEEIFAEASGTERVKSFPFAVYLGTCH